MILYFKKRLLALAHQELALVKDLLIKSKNKQTD